MTVAVEPIELIVVDPAQDGVYAFAFDWQGGGNLAVTLFSSTAAASDLPLTFGADYTTTPATRAAGGQLTLLRDPAGYDRLLIRRATEVAQTFDAPPTADGFEAALDRVTMFVQERLGEFQSSLRLPVGLSNLRLPLGAGAFVWNASRTAIELAALDASTQVVTPSAGGGATNLRDTIGLVPAAFGVVTDGASDTRTQVQAMIDAAHAQAGDMVAPVDGRGAVAAIDGPLTLKTGIDFRGWKIVATGAGWGEDDALLQGADNAYNIRVRDTWLECNRAASHGLRTQPTNEGNIYLERVIAHRYVQQTGSTKRPSGFWMRGSFDAAQCEASQWQAQDAANFDVSSQRSGYGFELTDNATDSFISSMRASRQYAGVYVGPGVQTIFIDLAHPYQGGAGGGPVWTDNHYLAIIDGYDVTFPALYADRSRIRVNVNSTTPFKEVALVIGCVLSVAGNTLTQYPAWLELHTDQAGSNSTASLKLGPGIWRYDNAQPAVLISRSVSGSGSWLDSDICTEVQHDFVPTRNGLIVGSSNPLETAALSSYVSHPTTCGFRVRRDGLLAAGFEVVERSGAVAARIDGADRFEITADNRLLIDGVERIAAKQAHQASPTLTSLRDALVAAGIMEPSS